MRFRISKPFSLCAAMVCTECGGSGTASDGGSFGPCKICGGTGTVETSN